MYQKVIVKCNWTVHVRDIIKDVATCFSD